MKYKTAFKNLFWVHCLMNSPSLFSQELFVPSSQKGKVLSVQLAKTGKCLPVIEKKKRNMANWNQDPFLSSLLNLLTLVVTKAFPVEVRLPSFGTSFHQMYTYPNLLISLEQLNLILLQQIFVVSRLQHLSLLV